MGLINSDALIDVKLPRPGGSGGAALDRPKVVEVERSVKSGDGEVLGIVAGLALLGAFDDVGC